MTRIYEGARPAPAGIILEDYVEDVEIGLLKSGKEADVYLIERLGPARSCLLAAKRYVPAELRAFKADIGYRAHRRNDGFVRDGGIMRKRVAGRNAQKAMDQRSRFGRKALAAQWIGTEWGMLRRLYEAGASVPYPVELLSDGILMEYVGDREQAAPRLVDARIPREELPALYEQARGNLRTFARAGIVHGDLSPYNVLVWEGRLWFIDLPQAVPVLEAPSAIDFLHRDCSNLGEWFVRKGFRSDPEELFVEVLNEVFDLRMQDLFRAR